MAKIIWEAGLRSSWCFSCKKTAMACQVCINDHKGGQFRLVHFSLFHSQSHATLWMVCSCLRSTITHVSFILNNLYCIYPYWIVCGSHSFCCSDSWECNIFFFAAYMIDFCRLFFLPGALSYLNFPRHWFQSVFFSVFSKSFIGLGKKSAHSYTSRP